MTVNTTELQRKGNTRVTSLSKDMRVRGKLIRTAFLDGEGYQFLDDPERAVEIMRSSSLRPDLFTFVQKLSETAPKYKFPMEWDNIAALPVSTFDNWMKSQIDFKARNKVRKAAKNGVVIKEVPFDDALVRGIAGIYNEVPIRQGRRFCHYGEDLATVRQIKATFLDRSVFIGAFLQDELIGFAKLVANEDWTQAGLMHILAMIRHRDKAPTNALIAEAVRSCSARHIPYLWYANFSYGNKQQDSLAEFKINNGFQRVDVPRYFVPLTMKGRMALRLGMHHEINSCIPEALAGKYRKIRSWWYSRNVTELGNAARVKTG